MKLSSQIEIIDVKKGRKTVSKEMNKIILELSEAGLNSCQIGKIVGRSPAVVRYHIERKHGPVSL